MSFTPIATLWYERTPNATVIRSNIVGATATMSDLLWVTFPTGTFQPLIEVVGQVLRFSPSLPEGQFESFSAGTAAANGGLAYPLDGLVDEARYAFFEVRTKVDP